MSSENLPAEPDDLSAEMIAASLRADTADLEVYARVLSANLVETLPPGAVRLERKRTMADRAAGREGRVMAVGPSARGQRLSLVEAKVGPVGVGCRRARG